MIVYSWVSWVIGLGLPVAAALVLSDRHAGRRWPGWPWRPPPRSVLPLSLTMAGVVLFTGAGAQLGLLEGPGLVVHFGGVAVSVAVQAWIVRNHNRRVAARTARPTGVDEPPPGSGSPTPRRPR